MSSKASRLRSPLTLDILLYYLCWFPVCDPSWAHQLLRALCLYLKCYCRAAHGPGKASRPGSCHLLCSKCPLRLLEVLAQALGGSAKGVLFLVDHLLALLTINCASTGHVFHRVVCKADSPSEMLSTANGAWNIRFSLPSVAGSTPCCKEFIISWHEAKTQMYSL